MTNELQTPQNIAPTFHTHTHPPTTPHTRTLTSVLIWLLSTSTHIHTHTHTPHHHSHLDGGADLAVVHQHGAVEQLQAEAEGLPPGSLIATLSANASTLLSVTRSPRTRDCNSAVRYGAVQGGGSDMCCSLTGQRPHWE